MAALGAVLGVGLGGCAKMYDDLFGKKKALPPCPRVLVLADAAQIVSFRGDGQDLTDVLFHAEMDQARTQCKYELDDDDRPIRVSAKVVVDIVAERGPADRSRQATFSYFVALVDAQKNTVAKNTFPVTLAFEGNRNRMLFRDDDPGVVLDIPLREGETGRSYEAFVGFQLTPAQLEYNRRLRRRAVGG
ncbi:MAG: hypothetical protein H6907_05015 [Hyphomicrobiales bacterium]|nr:hypothetical protein [Hyphomicrobiales bacterium]MCP5371075.1 hypothetical protein [Hyphomicrobiales bacterium]